MFLISVCVLFLVLCFFDVSIPKLFPAGPKRFPLFGNYLLVRKLRKTLGYYHLVWDAISKDYGNIFSVKLGRTNAVIVSGYTAVRYVLSSNDFDGRPDGFFFRYRAFNKRLGVVFVEGPMWMEQKKFCMKYLRNRGYGGDEMEKLIKDEAKDLVLDIMKKSENGTRSVFINNLFDISVLNGLWSMLTDHRFKLNDPKIIKLLDMVHFSFRMMDMSGGILNNMPFLRFLAPDQTGFTDLKHILNEFYTFLNELVEEHRSASSDEDDFICKFLKEINKRGSMPSGSSFKEEQLLVILLDLFLSGSETTSSTLTFAILHLIENQHVQAKIYEEIHSVVGNRDICIADKNKLKYLNAFLMEVQRISNVAPMSVAHRTLRNTELGEYKIPKDTLILASIWSVHMDKDHWGDPTVFRPERFIDPSGQIIRDPWFIPFGFGRRKCIGEVLARMNMFMIIGKLVQTFEMQIPDGVKLPVMHQDGATISPGSFSANFIPRNI